MGSTPEGSEWPHPGANRIRQDLRRSDGADRADAGITE